MNSLKKVCDENLQLQKTFDVTKEIKSRLLSSEDKAQLELQISNPLQLQSSSVITGERASSNNVNINETTTVIILEEPQLKLRVNENDDDKSVESQVRIPQFNPAITTNPAILAEVALQLQLQKQQTNLFFSISDT